jgi:hypothetical protein
MSAGIVMSPLGAGVKSSSFYDKLNHLSAEISEGIVNLSEGKRWLIESELRRIQEEANREVSPEAVYSLLLFRRYAEIANQIKDANKELQSQVNNGQFPSFLPEAGNDENLLKGLDAAKSNLFWLRVLAAMFSFISYVVMATVPYVSLSSYSPSHHFSVRDATTSILIYFIANDSFCCVSYVERMQLSR